MVRVVRLGDGRLAVGRTLPGRGAWLCRDSASCVDRAAKRGAFGRALRCEVGSAQVERLRSELHTEQSLSPGAVRQGSVGTAP